MPGTDRDDLNLTEAFELARECLKSLLIINGGAAVAILAFFGQILTKDGVVTSDVRHHVASGLYWFSLGAFTVVVAFIAAYLTELLWGRAYSSETWQARGHQAAQFVHVAALLLTLASAGMFVFGVWQTRYAISPPTKSNPSQPRPLVHRRPLVGSRQPASHDRAHDSVDTVQ